MHLDEQARVKRNVVVANLEVFARGSHGHFPADAVNDEPMADLSVTSVDGVKRSKYPHTSGLPALNALNSRCLK